MGQEQDNQPCNSDAQYPTEAAETVLQTLTEELQNLQENLVGSLREDIERLKAEKSSLLDEIEKLKTEQAQLQSQKVRQYSNENAYRLLASLEATLSTTFRALKQDLNSYQSGLSQQLSRMYGLEQQAEGVLEVLVQRLRDRLQQEENFQSQVSSSANQELGPPTTIQPSSWSKPFSSAQIGWLLILLSTVSLSLYNIAIRVIFRQHFVFPVGELGGWIKPSLSDSLLILLLRMLVVVPLIAFLAPMLYPQVWQDLKRLVVAPAAQPGRVQKKRILRLAAVSGGFLFLSQVLIYIALGQIPTAIAITLFFVYPIITALLSWMLFRDRPTLLRLVVIGVVCLGAYLVVGSSVGIPGNINFLGSATAIGSGVAFAFYVIFTQICASSLHPVPFSIINFILVLFLSCLSLLISLPAHFSLQVNPANWPSLMAATLVLGGLTVSGYLLNNFGIRQVGAAPASIVGASVPALTMVLAYLIIQETLPGNQILGILLVTGGVVALNVERIRIQLKAAKTKKHP